MAETQSKQLGLFLRSRREKLSPNTVGLVSGQRRRALGLRREEVAELAGIGVDWYVRLEQGRSVRPSATTLDALARALRLNKTEQAHLNALTRTAVNGAFAKENVPLTLQRLVESLNQPAYITGRRWDVLAWNKSAADIFGFDRVPEADRNILVMMLTKAGPRKLLGDQWSVEARRMVAQFRPTHDLWADDPAFEELLARLRAGCPEFLAWWKSHDIRVPTAGRKKLRHPKKGAMLFEYATFQANDDPALKLAIYSPLREGD